MYDTGRIHKINYLYYKMVRACLILISATLVPLSNSFTPLMKIGSHSNKFGIVWNMVDSDDQEIYEAEELAAYDAHDAPDAGVEAAAMERAVMMADEMKRTHLIKGKTLKKTKEPTGSLNPKTNFSDGEIFEAEEAAVYDAHDLSDAAIESAAMERAVMIAYRLMANRRKNLKTQLDNIKSAEDEMLLLEKATDDLAKRYRENPTEFQSTFSESDTNSLALQMIERAIANAADMIFEVEVSLEAEKKEMLQAIERRNMAEAMTKRFQSEMKTSDDYSLMSEEFGDEQDIVERRRDKAASHALMHLVDDTISVAQAAMKRKQKSEADMERMKNKITRLQENQQSLKADLDELMRLINEKLEREWESETYVA